MRIGRSIIVAFAAILAAPFFVVAQSGPGAVSVEIETVEAAPVDTNVGLLGTLPPLPAPPRATELIDWNGQSPISLIVTFSSANQSAAQLVGAEVWVNGMQIPNVVFSAVQNGGAGFDGSGAVQNRVSRLRASFTVPYEIPATVLKVPLEVRVRTMWRGSGEAVAAHYLTLLNNAVLNGQFEALTNALGALASGDPAACMDIKGFAGAEQLRLACQRSASNLLKLCNATPLLRDAIGVVHTSLVAIFNGINNIVIPPINTALGVLVNAINFLAQTVEAWTNTIVSNLNGFLSGFANTWNSLRNWELVIDVPDPSIDVCPGDPTCNVGISIPAFSLGKPLSFLPALNPPSLASVDLPAVNPLAVPGIPAGAVGAVDSLLGGVQACQL